MADGFEAGNLKPLNNLFDPVVTPTHEAVIHEAPPPPPPPSIPPVSALPPTSPQSHTDVSDGFDAMKFELASEAFHDRLKRRPANVDALFTPSAPASPVALPTSSDDGIDAGVASPPEPVTMQPPVQSAPVHLVPLRLDDPAEDKDGDMPRLDQHKADRPGSDSILSRLQSITKRLADLRAHKHTPPEPAPEPEPVRATAPATAPSAADASLPVPSPMVPPMAPAAALPVALPVAAPLPSFSPPTPPVVDAADDAQPLAKKHSLWDPMPTSKPKPKVVLPDWLTKKLPRPHVAKATRTGATAVVADKPVAAPVATSSETPPKTKTLPEAKVSEQMPEGKTTTVGAEAKAVALAPAETAATPPMNAVEPASAVAKSAAPLEHEAKAVAPAGNKLEAKAAVVAPSPEMAAGAKVLNEKPASASLPGTAAHVPPAPLDPTGAEFQHNSSSEVIPAQARAPQLAASP